MSRIDELERRLASRWRIWKLTPEPSPLALADLSQAIEEWQSEHPEGQQAVYKTQDGFKLSLDDAGRMSFEKE